MDPILIPSFDRIYRLRLALGQIRVFYSRRGFQGSHGFKKIIPCRAALPPFFPLIREIPVTRAPKNLKSDPILFMFRVPRSMLTSPYASLPASCVAKAAAAAAFLISSLPSNSGGI